MYIFYFVSIKILKFWYNLDKEFTK